MAADEAVKWKNPWCSRITADEAVKLNKLYSRITAYQKTSWSAICSGEMKK